MGFTANDWLALTQTGFLLAFVVLIGIGAFTTTGRLIRYIRKHEHPPLILWRDVVARNSLAFPFIAIFGLRVARALGVDVTPITDSIWWVVGTSTPPVIGAAVYAYIEVFVIERDRGGEHEYPDGNHRPLRGAASRPPDEAVG